MKLYQVLIKIFRLDIRKKTFQAYKSNDSGNSFKIYSTEKKNQFHIIKFSYFIVFLYPNNEWLLVVL